MGKRLEVKKNFDWSDTKKKLALFMPNYNGRHLTSCSIQRIRTALPSKDWVIIVGNDNVEDNWDHLRKRNVVSFTLYHDQGTRNGAFIRNYAIQRCESQLFMQKDGEVAIEGDAISHAVRSCSYHQGWRAGNVCVLNPQQTKKYRLGNGLDSLAAEVRTIEPVVPGDINLTKKYLIARNGQINFTSYFHYAYCVSTKALKDIQGYDERYKFYGFEDTDCYLRLTRLGVWLRPDYDCYAIHMNHPSTVNREGLLEMAELFSSCDFLGSPVRNPGGWGKGV